MTQPQQHPTIQDAEVVVNHALTELVEFVLNPHADASGVDFLEGPEGEPAGLSTDEMEMFAQRHARTIRAALSRILAENERLLAERKEANRVATHNANFAVQQQARIHSLEREVERLREALLRFGIHDAECPVARMGIAQHEPSCRCGFARALSPTEEPR